MRLGKPEKGIQQMVAIGCLGFWKALWEARNTHIGVYFWSAPDKVARMRFRKAKTYRIPMVEICYLGGRVKRDRSTLLVRIARKEPMQFEKPKNAYRPLWREQCPVKDGDAELLKVLRKMLHMTTGPGRDRFTNVRHKGTTNLQRSPEQGLDSFASMADAVRQGPLPHPKMTSQIDDAEVKLEEPPAACFSLTPLWFFVPAFVQSKSAAKRSLRSLQASLYLADDDCLGRTPRRFHIPSGALFLARVGTVKDG